MFRSFHRMRRGQGCERCARRYLLAYVLGCIIMPMSCAPSDPALPAMELNTGSSAIDLLPEDGCGVVVLMSPRECMSCDGILEAWAERERTLRYELFVVLTSEPSVKQIEALQLRRVSLAGVASVSSSTSEPRAYLFTGRNVTDSIIGVRQQAMFLNQLAAPGGADDGYAGQRCWWQRDHREEIS